MEQNEIELSVTDVYDIAFEIGKEFEKIIYTHGSESVINIKPKVIYALENLENFALRNEKKNAIIQNLMDWIAKLEFEKAEKAQDQQKFERWTQGPLPYEPDDAPWKKSSDSYVRKL